MPFLFLFVPPYLYLNIAFALLSGAVALLVSYYAFSYNRLLESSTLKFISLGFVLLGVGLLAEASVLFLVIFGVGDLLADHLLALGASSLFYILQVLAYIVFAIGYIRGVYFSYEPDHSRDGNANITGGNTVAGLIPLIGSSLALPTSPGFQHLRDMILLSRAVFVVSELLSVVFISTVVFLGSIGYARTRNRLALLVLLSFTLLLAAQILALWSAVAVSVVLDYLSSGIQFTGFLSLLVFILWRGKIGSAGKTA